MKARPGYGAGAAGFVVRNQSALAIFQMGAALSAKSARIIAAPRQSTIEIKTTVGANNGGCLRIPVKFMAVRFAVLWIVHWGGWAYRGLDVRARACWSLRVSHWQSYLIAPHMNRDINEAFVIIPSSIWLRCL